MHHRSPVNDRVRRLQILPHAFAQFFQRVKHNFVGVGIFALRKVDSVEAVKELEQLLINFTKRQRAIDAQLRGGSFLPKAAAKPDFSGQIAHAVKQHAVVMRLIAFNQYQQRFGLIKAGEVPKVAALAVGIFRICAAYRFRRGENKRCAARLHLRQ